MNLNGQSVSLVQDDATPHVAARPTTTVTGSNCSTTMPATRRTASTGRSPRPTAPSTSSAGTAVPAPGRRTPPGPNRSTAPTPAIPATAQRASPSRRASRRGAGTWTTSKIRTATSRCTTTRRKPTTTARTTAPPACLYTRGGYLTDIDYGLRDENNTVYGNPAPDQVVFTVAERCSPSGTITCDPSQFTVANAKSWPDTPPDQQCAPGAVCNNHRPSFWSHETPDHHRHPVPQRIRIHHGGQLRAVPAVQRPRRSRAVARTRSPVPDTRADGTTITLPAVTFDGQMMDNRVAGYNNEPAMARYRIDQHHPGNRRAHQHHVHASRSARRRTCRQCRRRTPCAASRSYWTLPYETEPDAGLLPQVRDDGGATSRTRDELSPTQVTDLHLQQRPRLALRRQRAGQAGQPHLRPVPRLRHRPGPHRQHRGRPQTLTTTTYFLGMDGDTLPGGGTRSATVTDSLGETVPDADQFADSPREVQVFNGDGGAGGVVDDHRPDHRRHDGDPRPHRAARRNRRRSSETGKTRVLTDLAAGGDRTTTHHVRLRQRRPGRSQRPIR